MDRSISAGITGFILAVIITIFLPVPSFLSFVPSFLAAIFAIYIFRLGVLKDGLVAAFMTYIFNVGILNTIDFATLYVEDEPYPSFQIDLGILFSPLLYSITALIAGYVGVWLVQRMKPARELPPSLPPPLPPV